MASSAVPGRDHGGHLYAMVEKGVGFFGDCHVAVIAPYTPLGMGAAGPVVYDARVFLGVTVHALLRGRWHGDVSLS